MKSEIRKVSCFGAVPINLDAGALGETLKPRFVSLPIQPMEPLRTDTAERQRLVPSINADQLS
jgi:hypothetical protein